MFIDLLVLIAIAAGCIKGYREGLIMGIVSTLSLIIGLAAAIKLSVVATPWLAGILPVPAQYLPFIAFIVVFIAVAALIRLVGNLLQKTIQGIHLGWFNRVGGMVLFLAINLAIVSVLLYYAGQMNLISDQTKSASKSYSAIAPWAPSIIDGLANLMPWFGNLFQELTELFDQLAQEAKA